MVLTALENTYAKPMKEVTPFQHWFNKHSKRLSEEWKSDHKINQIDDNDKFMKWCKEKYNEK